MHFLFSGDDVIGKVTFFRQDMLSMNPAGGEVWYSLRPVDNASEVHGELHLKILATNYVSFSGRNNDFSQDTFTSHTCC